jgi:hypothetical protein
MAGEAGQSAQSQPTATQAEPVAPTSTPPAQAPKTQGQKKTRARSRQWIPEWISYLPPRAIPDDPDFNFKLISDEDLQATLATADTSTQRQIQQDIAFLQTDLMPLFISRDHEAKKQQVRYLRYQIGYILLAATATTIGGLQALTLTSTPTSMPIWAFFETLVALFVSYLASISGREPPMPLWLANRRRAEQLRREYFRYLMNTTPYDELDAITRQLTLSMRAADINRGVYPEEPV